MFMLLMFVPLLLLLFWQTRSQYCEGFSKSICTSKFIGYDLSKSVIPFLIVNMDRILFFQ